jgi:mycoredoxin
VRGLLAQAKVPYTYTDITRDPAAAARVRAINSGNESVPTLVFPDGSSLTEPTVGQLKSKLESLGYRVGPLGLDHRQRLAHSSPVGVIAYADVAIVLEII